MIADVYKCHECGANVYLAKDEEYCPICGEKSRSDMKQEKRDVDLSQDADLGKEAQHANFGHFVEVMNVLYGDRSGLYLMDCWKYAWDAKKTDSANIKNVEAFIENPNGYVTGTRTTPMTKEELKAEIERIVRVILSKCQRPRSPYEAQQNLFAFEKHFPVVRFFVKKDYSYVAAEVCTHHTNASQIYNYAPVEKKRAIPKRKSDCFVFTSYLRTDFYGKKRIAKMPTKIATTIISKCYRNPKKTYWYDNLWVIGKWAKSQNCFNNRLGNWI